MLSRVLLANLLLVLSFPACDRANDEASTESIRSVQGTLYVVPEGDIVGGKVTYNIYENGMITYMGDVAYNMVSGDLVNVELQPSFTGQYKASAAIVKSASFTKLHDQRKEFKVLFTVESVDEAAKTATLTALAASENAFGKLVVDTSGSVILIKSAEVTGQTPIGRIKFKLTDVKPN